MLILGIKKGCNMGNKTFGINNIKTRKQQSKLDYSQLPRLSKSRFQTGLQCDKALYLTCYMPQLADESSEMDKATQENGTKVGILAQQLYPQGELINEDYRQPEEALVHTQNALNDGASELFEAAFMHDNVLVRCDILKRNEDDTFDLIEVKSATSVKNQNITDVAVQMHVLEGAGIKVRNAYLMHLNSDYVYDGGNLDLEQLFKKEDVTLRAQDYAEREVSEDLKNMFRVLNQKGKVPNDCIGRHCTSPHICSFYSHCHQNLPEHPITELPRISEKLMSQLIQDNIWSITDIPAGYKGLTPTQERVRDSVVTNNIKIEKTLKDDLNRVKYPLHFLDFETMQTVVPEYVGTRPYQQIPFQWSDHIMDEKENLTHEEFLHQNPGRDPREGFVEKLLKNLERDKGSIVVYSDFEKQRLAELARDYPEYDERINKVIDRLFNLEKVVNQKVNHPEFKGKTSIKYVLPAIVQENDYENLEIKNGAVAMTRYRQAISGEVDQSTAKKTFEDLLVYCGVDTMSMVKVFNALKKMGK